MTKKTKTKTETDTTALKAAAYDDVLDLYIAKTSEVRGKARKLANQRIQLRMYQEKLALMKTPRGILRTIGQYLGICR